MGFNSTFKGLIWFYFSDVLPKTFQFGMQRHSCITRKITWYVDHRFCTSVSTQFCNSQACNLLDMMMFHSISVYTHVTLVCWFVCLTDQPYICHLPFGYDWSVSDSPLRASLCWESTLGCRLIYLYIIAIDWVTDLPKCFRYYNLSTWTSITCGEFHIPRQLLTASFSDDGIRYYNYLCLHAFCPVCVNYLLR